MSRFRGLNSFFEKLLQDKVKALKKKARGDRNRIKGFIVSRLEMEYFESRLFINFSISVRLHLLKTGKPFLYFSRLQPAWATHASR